MSISLTPLEDKIIVKQAEAETQTASGLFIPDNAKEKPQQGEVLAVGPGRRNDAGERIPVDVKVGDKVLYSKYGGTEVTTRVRTTSSSRPRHSRHPRLISRLANFNNPDCSRG